MKLKKIQLHPFGGVADRSFTFHDGLNLIEGPNEFGKSTLSKSRSRESGGFGLGLYLCKQIVLAHQGLLSISNQEEKGAVIFIQIPMEQ